MIMKALFLRVTGLIPLIIGIFLTQHAGKNLLEDYKSKNWPSITGKVLSSDVGGMKRIGSKPTSAVIAKVRYVYEVDGVSYTSSRISHNDHGSTKKAQKKIAGRYPQGATVKVFYNPMNPSSSILEDRIPVASFLTVAGGIGFILIGYFFIFKAPKIFIPPKIIKKIQSE